MIAHKNVQEQQPSVSAPSSNPQSATEVPLTTDSVPTSDKSNLTINNVVHSMSTGPQPPPQPNTPVHLGQSTEVGPPPTKVVTPQLLQNIGSLLAGGQPKVAQIIRLGQSVSNKPLLGTQNVSLAPGSSQSTQNPLISPPPVYSLLRLTSNTTINSSLSTGMYIIANMITVHESMINASSYR